MKQLRISQLFFFLQNLHVLGLQPYKNKEIALSTQNIYVNYPAIFDKYFYFLTNILVKKKKKCYNNFS